MEILKEMPRRDPLNGTFELTVRCNLKCKMCLFRHDDSENAEIIKNEKTAKEWIDMAKQVAGAGTINLLITGGEPMLRPDFCEIYEGIYKQGFIIELYTNATLVNDKIMETLIKYPPHKIGITIYGASDSTYEKVCGNGKAFDRMLSGVEKLITLPSNLEFRTTIIKDNYEDIDNIEQLIKDKFGEMYTLTQSRMVMKPVRGGNSIAEICRLTPEDNIKLYLRRGLNKIKGIVGEDRFNIKNIKVEIDKTTNNNSKKVISLFGCDAGMQSYTISWDGKLLACQILGNFYTYPFNDGFTRSWMNYPYKVKLPKLNEQCILCENKHLCSCCYASRYAETGNLGGCPKYVCEDVDELVKFL